ncbi:acetyltransferase/esterase [Rhexocercosporidium sp. MPI-PUGE-AT-0058]|nr:acetyltransferase/esterase [Rhexocercosporidium sp. MPI-PUGE-AT-0058]
MTSDVSHGTVENEECTLKYWYQGRGPLITFIPGGNGHGRQYDPLMALLSPTYTCVTFDRRQMSSSQVKANKILNPYQQARDVLAVIKAMGREKSIVFGSSLGGVLGFQLACDYPDVIDHLICHEAPTVHLLPDRKALTEDLFETYNIFKTQGLDAVNAHWGKHFAVMNDPDAPHFPPPEESNPANFFENEFLVGTFWNVDFEKIKGQGTSVGVMTGEKSGDEFFARTTYEQERVLGCLREMVPGHHQGFQAESEVFLGAFLGMLERLEMRRSHQKIEGKERILEG